mgnify:FL=1
MQVVSYSLAARWKERKTYQVPMSTSRRRKEATEAQLSRARSALPAATTKGAPEAPLLLLERSRRPVQPCGTQRLRKKGQASSSPPNLVSFAAAARLLRRFVVVRIPKVSSIWLRSIGRALLLRPFHHDIVADPVSDVSYAERRGRKPEWRT